MFVKVVKETHCSAKNASNDNAELVNQLNNNSQQSLSDNKKLDILLYFII